MWNQSLVLLCALLASASAGVASSSSSSSSYSFPDLGTIDMENLQDLQDLEELLKAENQNSAASPELMDSIKARYLAGVQSRDLFLYAGKSWYSGWQQAWRMLGWFVDCSNPRPGGGDHHRRMPDDHGDQNQGNGQCTRYLMWAAYIDPNYQGGGQGEYAYWNLQDNQWDDNVCKVTQGDKYYNESSGTYCRAKYDCHVPGTTTWRLMGVYKEAWYASQWFEQLFKHQGYCIWDNNDAWEFMHTYYDSWPQGCIETGYSDSNGNALYIDVMPASSGYLRTDLYTDQNCRIPLGGNNTSLLITVRGQKGYLTGSDLQKFNYYLEPFKVCQPCRTINNNNYHQRNLGNGDDNYDPNGGQFECNDYAGYTNVNQCMKFRTHTTMQVATLADLNAATQQGGIVKMQVGDAMYGVPEWSTQSLEQEVAHDSEAAAVGYLAGGGMIFALGMTALVSTVVWSRRRRQNSAFKEPLVDKTADAVSIDTRSHAKESHGAFI